ncbi:hypothetical protein CLAIMM_14920 [Cladophialophora immunda]|nr:hypothetical protein CLAIMM_14920 [Cladophialophora immunda]
MADAHAANMLRSPAIVRTRVGDGNDTAAHTDTPTAAAALPAWETGEPDIDDNGDVVMRQTETLPAQMPAERDDTAGAPAVAQSGPNGPVHEEQVNNEERAPLQQPKERDKFPKGFVFGPQDGHIWFTFEQMCEVVDGWDLGMEESAIGGSLNVMDWTAIRERRMRQRGETIAPTAYLLTINYSQPGVEFREKRIDWGSDVLQRKPKPKTANPDETLNEKKALTSAGRYPRLDDDHPNWENKFTKEQIKEIINTPRFTKQDRHQLAPAYFDGRGNLRMSQPVNMTIAEEWVAKADPLIEAAKRDPRGVKWPDDLWSEKMFRSLLARSTDTLARLRSSEKKTTEEVHDDEPGSFIWISEFPGEEGPADQLE